MQVNKRKGVFFEDDEELSSSLAKTGETLCKIAISQQPEGVVRTHFVGLLITAIPAVVTSGVRSDEELVMS